MADSRDSTELKIGQVWRDRFGNGREIVALGPEWLMYRDTGARIGFSPCGVAHFRSLKHTLVRPKHELWVNVMRELNDNLFARVSDTRITADFKAQHSLGNVRIACIKIEFEEGEGL